MAFKEKGEIILGSTDCPIGFCKVKVPKYLEGDVSNLPLVAIMGPLGNAQNEGSNYQVNIGDKVWVEFQMTEGGKLRPLVVGSAYLAPDGLPNLPHDSFDGPLTLYKKHLIPRSDDGEVHEDFEEPKRYVRGRAIAFVKEGISWVIQNGQSILTHLKTLSHLIFLENGSIDLFSKTNLFIRARNNLHLWGNQIKFKGKGIEFDLDELLMELKKFGVDAQEINLNAGGLAKIVAGAIQFSAMGDLIISSTGKTSQDANGSSLTKVSQNMTTDPLDAMGWMLDIQGVPLASFLLKSYGLFELKNTAMSLKTDVLDRKLDHFDAILGFLDDFLTFYIEHAHPCVVPTGQPFNALDAIVLQVKVQLEMVKAIETRINLSLLME